ncbi:Probable polyol transporter 6 [Galdieria sulphuraria]|nr:Probable polyol transporter 6 [Galdieria sulphuraria]
MATEQDETVLAIQEEEKTSKPMAKGSLLQSVEAGLEITDDMKSSVFQIIEELKEEYEKDDSKKVSAAGVFRNPKRFMWFLAIFASIGGFLYGIDISLISGALLFMKVDLNLDTSQQSLVSSGMSLGGVAGALISMPVNELGRRVDAYATWLAVRGFNVEEEKIEFAIMEEVVIAEREASKDRFLYLDFIRIPYCRRAAIHGILMMVFQQFSGNNSMTYFLGTMYERAGLSAENSVYISMLGGGTMFWSTIPAIYLMDRFGRRPLLLILVPGVVAGLIITGFSFYAPTTTSLIVVYTIGVVSYYAFWGSALGPTPWVMNSEIYPTYIRSYGMSLGTLSNFLGNWITTYAFLQMLDAMTKPGTYVGFYGGITVIGWFYFLFFTPETKNLTLEEIKAVFSKTWMEIAKHNMEDFRYQWNKFWHKRRGRGEVGEQVQTVSS